MNAMNIRHQLALEDDRIFVRSLGLTDNLSEWSWHTDMVDRQGLMFRAYLICEPGGSLSLRLTQECLRWMIGKAIGWKVSPLAGVLLMTVGELRPLSPGLHWDCPDSKLWPCFFYQEYDRGPAGDFTIEDVLRALLTREDAGEIIERLRPDVAFWLEMLFDDDNGTRLGLEWLFGIHRATTSEQLLTASAA